MAEWLRRVVLMLCFDIGPLYRLLGRRCEKLGHHWTYPSGDSPVRANSDSAQGVQLSWRRCSRCGLNEAKYAVQFCEPPT